MVSKDAIQDYAERPDELPPARVAEIDGRMLLVGGLHRLRAWERAGRSAIPCVVERTSWPEAGQAGVADNKAHGVRLSAKDKRASIRLLLAEVPDLSDRAIAELVGCSPSTVGSVRADVEAGLSQVSDPDNCPPPPVGTRQKAEPASGP